MAEQQPTSREEGQEGIKMIVLTGMVVILNQVCMSVTWGVSVYVEYESV